MAIVLMIGPPGAGKGTQCRMLEEKLGWVQISTGDVLRSHIKDETPLGLKAKAFVDEGQLVPDALLLDLLLDKFSKMEGKTILLDGYPRNVKQAETLAKMANKFPISVAVHLNVDTGVIKDRLTKRAEIEARSDDAPEKIEKRLQIYIEQTEPILEFYKKEGKYFSINGAQSIEEVHSDVIDVFQKVGLAK